MIAPGCNLNNPDLPFVHLTEIGRIALQHFSRDPTNPYGYLAHLIEKGLSDDVVHSYISEAVNAFNSNCYKSVAVMVGCATERYVLLIRDELVQGLSRKGNSPAKKMTDWRYKTVRDAITRELDSNQNAMDHRTAESYSAFWIPLTEQPRLYRNDA